jgi:hypothetical protein
MAIDFPNSPTTGQQFVSGTTVWQWDGTKWEAVSPGPPITISDTPPATPRVGALWWDSTGAQLYIYYADPTSSQWVPVTNEPGAQGPTGPQGPGSGYNKLMNGFLEIDQVNGGAAVATNNAGSVDGWRNEFNTGVLTMQRVVDAPPGYTYSVRATVTTAGTVAAGNFMLFQYGIEADDLYDTLYGSAAALPLTLSFWCKASLTGIYGGAIRSGPTPFRSYPFPIVINTANTWQLVNLTIPGDALVGSTWVNYGNALGAYLFITLGSGSTYAGTPNTWQTANLLGPSTMTNSIITTAGATFSLGPIKLELGQLATPMVRSSMQEELARCMRYYQTRSVIQGIMWQANPGDTYRNYTTVFPVPMRAAPTMTFNGGTAGWAIAGMDVNGFGGNNNLGNTTGVASMPNYVADARL